VRESKYIIGQELLWYNALFKRYIELHDDIVAVDKSA